MPEAYRDADPAAAFNKVWSDLDQRIKADAERGARVDKPEGFAWTPPEPLAKLVGDQGRDPYIKSMQLGAHEAGLTDKQFQTLMSKAAESLAGMQQGGSSFEPEANAAIKDGNFAWIDNMKAQNRFSPHAAADLEMLAISKGGSEIIALLQASLTPGFVAAPAGAQAGAAFGVAEPASVDDANRLMADPRYMSDSEKYDPRFRQWVDEKRLKLAAPASG